MKIAALFGCFLLSSFIGSSALSQSWHNQTVTSHSDIMHYERVAPVTMFARYAFQPPSKLAEQPWQVGVSFVPRTQSQRLLTNQFFGSEVPNNGVEWRVGQQAGLWSSGSKGRWLADFTGNQSVFSATARPVPAQRNVSNLLVIGGVVVGVIAIATATSNDSKPLLCTGNTVPNPIAGTCEPLR